MEVKDFKDILLEDEVVIRTINKAEKISSERFFSEYANCYIRYITVRSNKLLEFYLIKEKGE